MPHDFNTFQQNAHQNSHHPTFQSTKKPVEKSPSVVNFFDSQNKNKFNFHRIRNEDQRSKSQSNDSKESSDAQADFVLEKSRRSQSEESKDNKAAKK